MSGRQEDDKSIVNYVLDRVIKHIFSLDIQETLANGDLNTGIINHGSMTFSETEFGQFLAFYMNPEAYDDVSKEDATKDFIEESSTARVIRTLEQGRQFLHEDNFSLETLINTAYHCFETEEKGRRWLEEILDVMEAALPEKQKNEQAYWDRYHAFVNTTFGNFLHCYIRIAWGDNKTHQEATREAVEENPITYSVELIEQVKQFLEPDQFSLEVLTNHINYHIGTEEKGRRWLEEKLDILEAALAEKLQDQRSEI